MKTKNNKKHNETPYVTYDDLYALGFGSWLKKNAGTIGTVLGATVGTAIAPGVGTQIGATIGGSIGGSVQANEADKEATDAQNKLIAQQEARAAAEAQYQKEINNSPKKTFAPVMATGGEVPEEPVSSNTISEKYFFSTPMGEVEINASDLDKFKKYLQVSKYLRDYYLKKYQKEYNKLLEGAKANGYKNASEYVSNTGAYNPVISVEEALNEGIKNKIFTDEHINAYSEIYNKYTPVHYVAGKNELGVTLPTQTMYGVRNAEQLNSLRLIAKIQPLPGYKDYSYENVPGYSHMYYKRDKNNNIVAFVNQANKEIPIDSKKGINPVAYGISGEFQQEGTDNLPQEYIKEGHVSRYPYFIYKYENEPKIKEFTLNEFLNTTENADYMMKDNTKRKVTHLGQFEEGGSINYKGQTHEGPHGGIPIDSLGNPIAKSNDEPVATVEDGEVAFTHPSMGTYIFSNKLKFDKNKTFADKAKDIQNKYKLRMKDGKINDPISEIAYNKEMTKLIEAQEAFREVSGVNKEEAIKEQFAQLGMPIENNTLPVGENGIYIKPSKRGTFTAAAKKSGMGVQEFAKHVLANKEDYSSTMVKKANFARNAAKWNTKLGGGLADTTVGIGEAVLPAIASTIGNSILLSQMNKRKIDTLNTTPLVAPKVDLSYERNSAIEQARALEAQNRRNAILTGSSAAQINQNSQTGALGIQRNLGEILSKSYSTEALKNAELKAQTDRANLERELEEQKFNASVKMERDRIMDIIRSQIANSWAQAASTYLAGRREFNTLNMQQENYQLENKDNSLWGILFPKLTKTVTSKTVTSPSTVSTNNNTQEDVSAKTSIEDVSANSLGIYPYFLPGYKPSFALPNNRKKNKYF